MPDAGSVIPKAVRAAAAVVAPVPPLAMGSVPAVALLTSRDVTGMAILLEPSKLVAVPVAPPEMAMVRAVASLAAVAALPEVLPTVVVMLTLAEPSKLAEPVTPPVRLMVRGVVSLVAVVAVAALPEMLASPVDRFTVNGRSELYVPY